MPPLHVMRSKCPYIIAATFGVNALGGIATAQSAGPASPPPEPLATGRDWVDLVPIPIELKGLPADASELCKDKPGGLAWMDRVRGRLYRTICLSAARFDGFFGNARFDDEYQATHGTVAVGALWDERDRWDQSVRFRAHVRLPQLSERFNAFVSRLDPNEYVTELRDDFDTLPRQFAREDDDEVLLGLGYRQPGRGGGHFDAGVGARLGWPVEPWVKGTYRVALPFLDRNLLRLHETAFWQQDEGFGATTRADLERLLAEDFLVRWIGSGTFAQATDGIRWFSTFTLYQSMSDGRAMAYEAGISGESDRAVAVADYGIRVIHRRRIYREWLFLELRSSLTWPRESLLEDREPNWGAGVAIEMLFGERRRK